MLPCCVGVLLKLTLARKKSLQKATAKFESYLETLRILVYYNSTFRASQTCMAATG